jgi:hypothetical protein
MIAYRAARDWTRTHFYQQPDDRMVDAVLAALFDACEVREQPHMWLHGGIRTGRSLILRFPLPDLPIPPAPEGLADLIRSRIGDPPPAPVFPDDDEEADRG